MRNRFFKRSYLLAAVAVLTACSNSEEWTGAPPQSSLYGSWMAKVTASRDSVVTNFDELQTRAAFVGGNTDRFMTAWDQGDIVRVYKGSDLVGTMTPLSSYYGTVTAELEGTLTGPFAVNDELTLYLPSIAMDFTGQTGTLQSVSAKSYQVKSAIVTEAQDNILRLSDVNMNHRPFYVRFYLTDSELPNNRLHPERLEIHAVEGNEVITHVAEDGTVTYGDLVINCEKLEGEYPGELYVAMYDGGVRNSTYRIKAKVGEDYYVGPIEGQNAFKPGVSNFRIGALTNVRRQMRKTTPVNTLSIADVADRTFTGSAHEPLLTVTDGGNTLTLDADYAVEYAGNVNAGTATATVRGKAMDGAQCTTPYLGSKQKIFYITKATPVITMATETMTLETGIHQTRAVSAVSIDNSAYDIANLDIMAAPYSCTVTYSSADPAIASVDSGTGEVTGVATGTTTITATVAGSGNWNAQTKSYTVKVSPRVNAGGNANWTVTEDAEEIPIYQ